MECAYGDVFVTGFLVSFFIWGLITLFEPFIDEWFKKLINVLN